MPVGSFPSGACSPGIARGCLMTHALDVMMKTAAIAAQAAEPGPTVPPWRRISRAKRANSKVAVPADGFAQPVAARGPQRQRHRVRRGRALVSKRFGHADAGFFLQTYAHVLKNDDRGAAGQRQRRSCSGPAGIQMMSRPNIHKSIHKWHENGPRRILRGPFRFVAGTGFEPATSGL